MHTLSRRQGHFAALLLAVLCGPLFARPAADPLAADPPPDPAARAGMEELAIASHEAALNAVYYRAAGTGAHGTVVLLHGFPGFEQNEDLAQALRRAGWNVLIFHYRGAWGSPGSFSFSHCVEDVEAVLGYLRDPANAARLRVDPHRLVLIGHSVGGVLAGVVAARDPHISGVAMISAANRHVAMARPGWSEQTTERYRAEMGPLQGTTPQELVAELTRHAPEWDLVRLAPQWQGRPVLIVHSDDMFAEESAAFAAVARASDPAHLREVYLATDHVYSDARIALTRAVLSWIAALHGARSEH
jgi:uncharacterized protein